MKLISGRKIIPIIIISEKVLDRNCQLMVVSAIQCQQESPIWGAVVKKEILFSAKQLNDDAAQL